MNEKKSDQPSTSASPRPGDPDRCVSRTPLSMTQKTVAKRMMASARDIPQFSVSVDLDADALAAMRSRINSMDESVGRRASSTVILICLAARALVKHPRLNAEFDSDSIIQHDSVNIAVAMATPQGLTAPVIRRAETLTVFETADAMKDLVMRAKDRRLMMSDFVGATFTLSSLAMFGATRFTPLINPPQAAIMGVSAPRDSMRTDADGLLMPARVMEVTVTADHRILDGAKVARFLKTLKESVKKEEIVG
jgi:pyruvate dehydrogenase E2 component (dihydrolipoamide acetyltransferase)